MTGWQTLLYKEVLRFWKVAFQTVGAPVLTSVLYMLIFGHVLEDHVKVYDNVPYTSFLLPGLMMMGVLQNAFANSSSSLVQSKIMGSLVFLLLTPLSHRSWFVAYVGSSVVRGLAVGLGVFVITGWMVNITFVNPFWILAFAVMGAALMGSLGVIAGLWAEKFDQMAAFQNFIIMPMTFLSGVFYSIHSLPPVWQTVSHLNPFFYMIDGFRYGFFGQSDTSPWLSLGVVGGAFALVAGLGKAGIAGDGAVLGQACVAGQGKVRAQARRHTGRRNGLHCLRLGRARRVGRAVGVAPKDLRQQRVGLRAGVGYQPHAGRGVAGVRRGGRSGRVEHAGRERMAQEAQRLSHGRPQGQCRRCGHHAVARALHQIVPQQAPQTPLFMRVVVLRLEMIALAAIA